MERRRAKRVTVNLKAERISCTENCAVFIENISKTGISMLTVNRKYKPGSEIDLELELTNGDVINLNCNVKWSYETSKKDKSNNVGLEIVDPPKDYLKFLNALH